MAIKPTTRPPAAPPLAGGHVLIVDNNRATAQLLRSHLEDRNVASVEIATSEDEALDILGTASRPIRLAMMDTLTDGAACVGVLRVLVKHRARVHVTLHGRHAPEEYAVPRNLVGAAGYSHQGTAAKTVALAEAVVAAGLTVERIIDMRIVPSTLDMQSALAIYGAPPKSPFPIRLKV